MEMTNANGTLTGGKDFMSMQELAKAADSYAAYEDLCNKAAVSLNCPHGFRWNRCMDGCQIVEHGGLMHFEHKVAPKKFVCRGHA